MNIRPHRINLSKAEARLHELYLSGNFRYSLDLRRRLSNKEKPVRTSSQKKQSLNNFSLVSTNPRGYKGGIGN